MESSSTHTDRAVTVNRPDIILKSKKYGTCVLVGVAIPADRNVVQKGAENKLKYNRYMKYVIIEIVTGVTGTVTKGFKKHLKAIPGTHSVVSPQKTAVLGTSHILRKALQCEI